MLDLGLLANTTTSAAYDINERYGADGFGQIVGTSGTYATYVNNTWQQETGSAFLYGDAVMYNIGQMICPNYSSSATAINNRGEITGLCGTDSYNYQGLAIFNGFIYGSKTGDFSIFPDCQMIDINDDGWALCASSSYPALNYLIVDGAKYNLIDLILPVFGITEIEYISAINDRGQILAITNLGITLLTPVE